jgi:Fe-S cluster biogenesis protein NfuA
MAESAGPVLPRLDEVTVRERLAWLDELLAQVEAIPGPAGELALDAVSALAEVYGEALARAVEHASGTPAVLAALTADELLGHLLVLHRIHPDPLEQRVRRALDALRPALRERGGDVELAGIDQDVARVRLSISGCSSAGVEDAVREAVLAAAPELSEVQCLPPERDPAFIPLTTVLRKPAITGTSP